MAPLEALGGMRKAIEAGLPKLHIEEAAARRQAAIEAGEETIIGANKYQPSQQEPLDILPIDHTAVPGADRAPERAAAHAQREHGAQP